jgi:peptide deformylase
MASLKIVELGEPVLRQKCRRVSVINKKVKKLLTDMKEAMYEANGVGLAAPQVGVSKRVVVVDVGEGVWELINPEIVSRDGEELGVEGCLSIPGVAGEVSRAARVKVRALNRDGQHTWRNKKPTCLPLLDPSLRKLRHHVWQIPHMYQQ